MLEVPFGGTYVLAGMLVVYIGPVEGFASFRLELRGFAIVRFLGFLLKFAVV